VQDLKYAVRTFLQKPGFTLLAIVALALAIGASSAMFSVVNAVILKPLDFDDSENVVVVWESAPKLGFEIFSTAPANFVDWAAQAKSFEAMAAIQGTQFTLTGFEAAERVPGLLVSADFFKLVRTHAFIGRTLQPEDAVPGKNKVVVVSYGFWNRRLGKDVSATSKKLQLGGESYDIVGVMPERFRYPAFTPDIWAPLDLTGEQPRGGHFVITLGRLKPGASLESAGAEMKTIAAALAKAYPRTNENWTTKVVNLHADIIKDLQQSLYILFGAVGFVLLIACANVANLLLARGADRAREIAVRTAMGAQRGRVIRQLLTESVLLSMVGGVAGIGFAYVALSTVVAMAPPNLPRIHETTIDRTVLGFSLLISLVTGIVFGIVPALQISTANLTDALKEATRGSSARRYWTRHLLVIAEVALTIVVLIGAGLMIRSLGNLSGVNPGFDPQHVLTAQFNLPAVRYKTGEEQIAFIDRVLDRISALPGVTQVGTNSFLPLAGGGFVISYTIQGRPPIRPQDEPSASMRFISPNYFAAIKAPVIQGRGFTSQDRQNSPLVIIVNEAFVRREFPHEDPINKQMSIGYGNGQGNPPRTIVGVVKDMKINSVGEEVEPQYYVPFAQLPFSNVALAVRTSGDPAQLTAALRNVMKELDPDIAVFNLRPFEEVISTSLSQSRFNAGLLGAFAGIAMFLACFGVYGVMSYSVNQRTRELGIRMALGQERSSVLKMIIMQALGLSGIGVLCGLIGAAVLTRLMRTMLFGVDPADPQTFILVAVSLVIVAVGAGYLPARRATQVDPLVALRHE
jgi:putative ABC transport system permease protein